MIKYLIITYLGIGLFFLFFWRMWLIPRILKHATRDEKFWKQVSEDAGCFFDKKFTEDELKRICESIIPNITLKTVCLWFLLWPYALYDMLNVGVILKNKKKL